MWMIAVTQWWWCCVQAEIQFRRALREVIIYKVRNQAHNHMSHGINNYANYIHGFQKWDSLVARAPANEFKQQSIILSQTINKSSRFKIKISIRVRDDWAAQWQVTEFGGGALTCTCMGVVQSNARFLFPLPPRDQYQFLVDSSISINYKV